MWRRGHFAVLALAHLFAEGSFGFGKYRKLQLGAGPHFGDRRRGRWNGRRRSLRRLRHARERRFLQGRRTGYLRHLWLLRHLRRLRRWGRLECVALAFHFVALDETLAQFLHLRRLQRRCSARHRHRRHSRRLERSRGRRLRNRNYFEFLFHVVQDHHLLCSWIRDGGNIAGVHTHLSVRRAEQFRRRHLLRSVGSRQFQHGHAIAACGRRGRSGRRGRRGHSRFRLPRTVLFHEDCVEIYVLARRRCRVGS